jgi:hypothetical protein
MSTGLDKFLVAVTPTLLELGKELFLRHDGNVQHARNHISSRIGELRREREAIDAEARAKFRRRT